MDKRDELIAEANKRWKEGDIIQTIKGEFISYNGERFKSDSHYSFSSGNTYFHYDLEGDTLSNWGRGMGLIYRNGLWAGEETYSIY